MRTSWAMRIVLALSLAIAGELTVLISLSDRLHLRSQRIAGYGFLFGTPWAWLVDRGWFGDVHNRWLESFITYAVVLWIPALLYSSCLWLLFHAAALWRRRPGT